MKKNNIRTSCLVCKKKSLKEILDLGIQPFADTFIPESRLTEIENTYPLVCQLCNSCKNIQLKYVTDPNKRYNDFEYSYTSSNSNFATSHWDELSNFLKRKNIIKKESKVLEIGSNDGYLLSKIKNTTINIVGLDASKKMSEYANKKRIFTINGLLNLHSKEKIIKSFKKFDLVIANNVINHMDDLKKSLIIIKSLLNKNGIFIFEQPYWLDTIKTKRYDQVYHEHITYFTVNFASNLSRILNLKFFDFDIVNYHGKSIRFYFTLNNNNIHKIKREKIKKQIKLEVKNKLFDYSYYRSFQNQIILNRNKTLEKILYYYNKNYSVIAVGAAAKSNTWLNFHKIDNKIIKFITDRSENKINKYTPLSRIKVVDDINIKYEKKPIIIILTWNIFDILKAKILKLNKSAKFIKV